MSAEAKRETKEPFVWYEGRLLPESRVLVPISTHALHYGTGVFEGIRCYGTAGGAAAVFRLKEHIDRMYASADVLDMKVPFGKEEIIGAALETIRANELKDCYIRPLFFFGEGPLGVRTENPVRCAVMVKPWPKYFKKECVSVKIVETCRLHPKSANMGAKVCGYYANSVMATNQAKKAGADEALLLDHNGNVAEGAGQNIFLVAKEPDGSTILLTPKLGNILPGITRSSIMEIAREEFGYETHQVAVPHIALFSHPIAELFFCGTAVEVCPIGQIEGENVGDGSMGEVTKKIKEFYGKVVRGEVEQYKKWLTYV